jgi:hypothetical protein
VHAYGALRLRVQLSPEVAAAEARGVSQAAQLRTALTESKLLEIVPTDDSTAAARVYLIEPRDTVAPGAPVPQIGPVMTPVWALVGTNGELQLAPQPLDSFGKVSDKLVALARARQALELENPSPNSALRGKFELELLRRGPDRAWVPAQPDAAGGLPVYQEGDDIAFEIKSRHDARTYVNLVDFNAVSDIGVIFPPPEATDAVTPTVRFTIGTRADEEFAVSLPETYPFSADGTGPSEALETVKLFATTTEADFRFLEQRNTRSAGGPKGPLQLLWETAAGEGNTRDVKRKTLPVDTDDWTTVVRSFIVRRKGVPAQPGT